MLRQSLGHAAGEILLNDRFRAQGISSSKIEELKFTNGGKPIKSGHYNDIFSGSGGRPEVAESGRWLTVNLQVAATQGECM